MRRGYILFNIFVIFVLLMTTSSLQAGEIRISIAASMTDLFRELITDFNKSQTDIRITPNFGPSGGLAKQINQGAPADIYVSANPKWMSYLLEQNKIEASTQKTFAHNTLVFIGRPGQNIASFSDLASLKRIGIGSPRSVPAGQYAMQALEKMGLYNNLLQAGKLVMAKDVRQALIYADRGETEGSFVYKTDARLAREATILFEINQKLYSKVTYPVAITIAGAENPEAKTFYSFITSASAKPIIAKYGFTLPQ